MPQALAKVTKKITRKKGRATGLHEKSRDARKLHQAGAREERVRRLEAQKTRAEEGYVQRIAFFQAALRDLESDHPSVLQNLTGSATAASIAGEDLDTQEQAIPETMDSQDGDVIIKDEVSSAAKNTIYSASLLLALTETYISTLTTSHPSSKSYSSSNTLPFVPNRPSRPPTAADDRAAAKRQAIAREFESGYWVPDLRDAATREELKRWRGDWAGLSVMKFVRVDRSGATKASGFPPRGGV